MKINKSDNCFYYLSRKFLLLIATSLICVFTSTAMAEEYVYISDNLRVGVRKDPVSNIPPISVVFTGMRLQVLDRKDAYIKISTDEGVTGWIKDIYVTNEAPAIIQLNAFKEKYAKLEKEISQGSNTVSVLEKANQALSEKLDELKTERREWKRERADLLASQYEESSWWWVIMMLILVIGSFLGGIFWYKYYVMKRLGGLRV